MGTPQRPEGGQSALWNGPAGHAWVAMQQTLDRMFEPFEAILAEAAACEPASQVLDVGCGAGSTTLALAERLAAQGGCLAIDVSEPLIALARARAHQAGTPARFACADAGTYPFEPGSFDLVVSRFGVMFFDDPVRAFSNLRQAARRNAVLRFVAWRSPAENQFMTAAERATAALLPRPAVAPPDAPGQFAFAERQRVHSILERSGWTGIDIRAIDVPCAFAEPDLVDYLSRMGPLGRALPTLDEATRVRAVEAARAALEPYVHGTEVRFNAACWQVDARAPGQVRSHCAENI